MSKTNLKIKLVGEDGNAFCILGKVSRLLKQNGYGDLARQFMDEATSGDYNHLLNTVLDYVEAE